jgi:hypothetical protein
MSSPVSARAFFNNVKSESRVRFAPGESKVQKFTWSLHSTLANFMHRYSHISFREIAMGETCWLGLEQTYRAHAAGSGVNHNDVVVEYDLDTQLSGGCAFEAAERTHREIVHRTLNAPAIAGYETSGPANDEVGNE